MEINATLLVQVLNFVAAYIIMDRILLRLAATIIQTEDRKLGGLESEVTDLEKRISSRLRYNEDDWLILQKRLLSECPTNTIGQHVHAPHESSPPFLSTTKEHIASIAEPLKNSFVKHVLDIKDQHD